MREKSSEEWGAFEGWLRGEWDKWMEESKQEIIRELEQPLWAGHPLEGAQVYNPIAMENLLEKVRDILANPKTIQGTHAVIPYEGLDRRFWEIRISLVPVDLGIVRQEDSEAE